MPLSESAQRFAEKCYFKRVRNIEDEYKRRRDFLFRGLVDRWDAERHMGKFALIEEEIATNAKKAQLKAEVLREAYKLDQVPLSEQVVNEIMLQVGGLLESSNSYALIAERQYLDGLKSQSHINDTEYKERFDEILTRLTNSWNTIREPIRNDLELKMVEAHLQQRETPQSSSEPRPQLPSESQPEPPRTSLFPLQVVREAIQAVPAVKYAMGIAGIVAVIALIRIMKVSLVTAAFGTVIMIFLMTLLVIFARLAATDTSAFRVPILIFTWFVLISTIVITILLLTAAFWRWPVDLRGIFGGNTSETGAALMQRPKYFSGSIAAIYDNLSNKDKRKLGAFIREPFLYSGPKASSPGLGPGTTFVRFKNGLAVYFKFDDDTNPGSAGGRSFFIQANGDVKHWWLAKHYPRESGCWLRERPAYPSDRCKVVPDCFEPHSGIGSVWRCESDINAALGRPTTCETNFVIQLQEFEHGFLIINVPIFSSSTCSPSANIVQTESYVLFTNSEQQVGNIVMQGNGFQLRTGDVAVQTQDRWPIWTCTDSATQMCKPPI